MAKKFFSSNYGSPLMRVDNSGIQQAGQAYGQAAKARGQMFANIGSQIGGMIKQYGLNKEKRAELTGEIESAIKFNPEYLTRMTSTGDEMADKKAQNTIDKLAKGDLNMSQLKGLAGDLAMMEKVDLKAQKEEDRKIARQQSLINQKLLEQEFDSKNELRELKNENKLREDKGYDSLIRRGKEIKNMVQNGEVGYDNLNPLSKRLYNDLTLIESRQVPVDKYLYSTEEEAKAELDALEAKRLAGDIEEQGLEIAEKTKEAAEMPEFSDRASAVESVKDLPEGVSASFKKFKDGFDVELQYKAKEFTDIPSVPGFPNYKIVGGYVYEADPKTKKLTKLGSENFGEKSELLQKTIESLTTKEVEQYALAKFRAKEQNDDGDYMVEVDGETIPIPFNQDLENRLIYLDGLQNKLKTQIDLDLTTR
tara:strand:- start:3408 stop:4673 length:1266 start_codon:yes stop_codon:yes gene_type:complete